MIIRIDGIPWEGLDVCGEMPAAALDLEAEHERIRTPEPVGYRLHARIVAHEALVRGRIWLTLEFACSRCGEFFSTTVCESNFQEIYPFSDPHGTLDLTCDIRETIILAFPSFPICGKTCRGLCLRCGTNRNRSSCSCGERARDERWAALDGLAGR